MRVGETYRSGDRLRRVRRVGVGEAQPGSARQGHAGFEREALAGPARRRTFDTQHVYPWIPAGRVSEDRRRAVGGAVVRDDDLETREGLRPQGREARSDAPLLVARRHDHAHEGRSHVRGRVLGAREVGTAAKHRRHPAKAPQGGSEEERGGESEPRDQTRDYRPTNRGRRFSRNAAVPSL